MSYELRLNANGRVYSSLTDETLRRWIQEGRVLGHDSVRSAASPEWRPVESVPVLAALLPAAARRSPASPVAAGGPAGVAPAVGNPVAAPAPRASAPPAPRAATVPPARPPAAGPMPVANERRLPTVVTNDLGIPEPAHRSPRRARRRLDDSVMDMTPMIDVTFQLLIFFMFTNQLANPNPIEAPQAEYGRGVMPDGKQALLIDEEGNYYLGESTKPENISPSLDALVAEVTTNAEMLTEPLDVIITAHKNAKHLHVRQLVERLEKLDGTGLIHLGVEEKP